VISTRLWLHRSKDHPEPTSDCRDRCLWNRHRAGFNRMGIDRWWPVVLLVFVAGCGGTGGGTGSGWFSERTVALADWNDVDSAVLVGASRVEMALVGDLPVAASNTGMVRRFALQTAGDEPVTLTVSRQTVDDSGPAPMELSAKVGRLGSPAREQALLKAVRDRLEQLAGVDHSPIK